MSDSEMVDASGHRRSRSSCSMKSRGKCHKPGRVTRNSFFNYLRDFRKKSCGKSMVDIAKEGARKWHHLSDREKQKYITMACNAPKRKRKRHLRGLCRSIRKMKCASQKKRRRSNKCAPRRKKRSSLASRCAMKRARRPRKKVC